MDRADAGIIETLDDNGGSADGIEDQKDEKDLNAEPEQGNESLNDGGAEDPNAGEQAGKVEGEQGAENENAEPDLDSKLNDFKNEINKTLEEKLRPAEDKPRQITEEEWLKHEADWKAPRETIDRVTRQSVQVFDRMKEYVDSKFAAIEKDAQIGALKAEFPDIERLKPGMNEFLKDYDPKHHSNPLLLRKAAIYARGLNSKGDIQKIRSNGEKNRQVINKIRTSPGENRRTPSNGANRQLTAQERQAAEMMPGGEKAYREMKLNNNRVIAV